ncbi:hypothetical protein PanWU01x14_188270 [Parasponia andersonii]|uniref:Uncharacterized protein n=1 Tax=Parasponia andersonii TaxID=3476 RepID=A0A2P5C377_PARAD|nr:hypothetical protein PanWU01x14_188270 [Parasponia andersonii]
MSLGDYKAESVNYFQELVELLLPNRLANSILAYGMSTFKLPKTLCDELDKAVRRFWWTGSTDKRLFIALTSWIAFANQSQRG